ncbi:MAG: zinc ribbon domain-containing protein, partial [Clostridia bacterium]|nr:zinc ribbon domain-containing protein [Clostridia bacterium]
MKCIHCGKEIADGAKFCLNCGAKIADMVAENV